MNKLSGRHWIFIIGIISALIVSRWSEETAASIIVLLLCCGAGVLFMDMFS